MTESGTKDQGMTRVGRRLPSDPSQPVVRITDLTKRFRRRDGSVVTAVSGTTLDLHAGEFAVLLGPSGCGKTSLLRCVAGLERPDGGDVEVGGRVVFSARRRVSVPPQRRGLAMVFQSYALWPHMTALQNVSYPLQSQRPRPRREDVRSRATEALDTVGIANLARQYPNQMSGGQQQRVALARALVGGSNVVLFDEPLSNVDAKVREQLRIELLSMQREIGFAALYVTHDQAEAMQLGHRIAVLQEGVIVQIGTPREIYDSPASRYVAQFIGTSNEIIGSVLEVDGDKVVVETEIGRFIGCASLRFERGDSAAVIWRPERWRAQVSSSVEAPNTLTGTIVTSSYVGSHVEQRVRIGDHHFRRDSTPNDPLGEHDTVCLSIAVPDVRVLPVDDQKPDAEVTPTVQSRTVSVSTGPK